jgi:hypothetical protein
MRTANITFQELLNKRDRRDFLDIQDINGDTYIHYLVKEAISNPTAFKIKAVSKAINYLIAENYIGITQIQNSYRQRPLDLAKEFFINCASEYSFFNFFTGAILKNEREFGIRVRNKDKLTLVKYRCLGELKLENSLDKNLYQKLLLSLANGLDFDLTKNDKAQLIRLAIKSTIFALPPIVTFSHELLNIFNTYRDLPQIDLSSLDKAELELDGRNLDAIAQCYAQEYSHRDVSIQNKKTPNNKVISWVDKVNDTRGIVKTRLEQRKTPIDLREKPVNNGYVNRVQGSSNSSCCVIS